MNKKNIIIFLISIINLHNPINAQTIIKRINSYLLIDTDKDIGSIGESINVYRIIEDKETLIGKIKIIKFKDAKTAAKIIHESKKIVRGDYIIAKPIYLSKTNITTPDTNMAPNKETPLVIKNIKKDTLRTDKLKDITTTNSKSIEKFSENRLNTKNNFIRSKLNNEFAGNDYVYVNVEVANIRSGPNKNYDILYLVKKNDRLKIYSKASNWIKVKPDHTKMPGWIYSKLVSETKFYSKYKSYDHSKKLKEYNDDLTKRKFNELPENIQNWLKSEGLEDLWYNGDGNDLGDKTYNELPANFQNWLKSEGIEDLWYNGD